MNLDYITSISTFIGSVSILLTLIFLLIELKRNISQTKSANLINRDNQYYNFTNYWSEDGNVNIVLRGRQNFSNLNEKEIFKFEIYVENRVRMFVFSVGSDRLSNTLEFHYNRINDFFQYPGTMDCYKTLLDRGVIPSAWNNIIEVSSHNKSANKI